MATIIDENRKHLRRALRVECGLQETSDEPTSVTPFGNDSDYIGLANLDRGMITETVMDLAGSGFLNNGDAVPMRTESDSFRYGYISEDVARADGTFSTPFGVTIAAGKAWEYVTLDVMGQHGDKRVVYVKPTWLGGSATIELDTWTPGERAYIVGIYLGHAWLWSNENLLSVNLDLRSVNTEIGGELEVSSIEIQAYETTDYTDIIGYIPTGEPIWYIAGYVGDMSQLRKFYLSETISWDDNILTIKGQDASMLLENVEVPVDCDNYGAGWDLDYVVGKRIRAALASITYEEVGAPPQLYAGSQEMLYDAKAARSIISEYTGLLRNENYFRVTYVDAGRPTLTFGAVGRNWTIYADEIGEFDVIVENNKNKLQMVLPDYYMQYNDNVEEVKTTSGKTYFVELDPPIPYNNIWINPTPTSSEEINCSLFKFKAAASTTYTVGGYEMLSDLIDANNPYTVNGSGQGETYRFDYDFPLFVLDDSQSLTKLSLAEVIKRSNICYEFTYRGNPHIQPRDVLNVEIATWVDVMIPISGLWPEIDLYPAEDLYPDGAYKYGRQMVKTWETMTVDSVTLEHGEGGGLSSKIRARKGTV